MTGAGTPHYREVTSPLRPGSPRASTHSVRWRSIPPAQATRPGVRRQARLPGSAPLHRRSPRRPRQPERLRTPPPGAAVFRSPKLPAHRAPGKPPHHPQPAARGGASGGRQSRRPRTLAPQESSLSGMRIGKACEQSGRIGSRCRLRERRVKWSLFDARPLLHLTHRALGGVEHLSVLRSQNPLVNGSAIGLLRPSSR